MADKLNLPKLPDSPMFSNFDEVMTTEWQEFFRTLYSRAGGITGPSSDDLLLSDVSEVYSTPHNLEKRIAELEKQLSISVIQKDYNKRIDELEKQLSIPVIQKDYNKRIDELEKQLLVLTSQKDYGNKINELEKVIFSIPTLLISANEKVKFSPIGGICIKITNKTGANSVAGGLVRTSTANNDAVMLSAADELESIGVFLESGIADGSEAWVVVSGIADVAMEDNTAATFGNWVRSSITEIGYSDATNVIAPGHGIGGADIHFHEIGHCIESVVASGGGTHILARCILHFN